MAVSKPVRTMVGDLERVAGVELTPAERLLMSTDGTVTHMLEALTSERIVVDILDRHVVGSTLHRTVALEQARTGTRLVWARSEIELDALDGPVADELVDGDIGIGKVLSEECAETRREIIDMGVTRRSDSGFPAFVDTELEEPSLLNRTYRIYAAGRPIMTITEYFSRREL